MTDHTADATGFTYIVDGHTTVPSVDHPSQHDAFAPEMMAASARTVPTADGDETSCSGDDSGEIP